MADYIETDLKKMLDEGHTLIEARAKGLDIGNFPNKKFTAYTMPQNDFPDDYFELQNEGKYYFKLDHIYDYRRLPQLGIILKDGTIIHVDEWHLKHALWLKFNKPDGKNFTDLEGSINYIHFKESAFRAPYLSFVQGYDYKRVNNTNLYELISQWYDKREREEGFVGVSLTENQVLAILGLCGKFYLKFDDVVYKNVSFCLDSTEQGLRKIGRDNEDTINCAFRMRRKKERDGIQR